MPIILDDNNKLTNTFRKEYKLSDFHYKLTGDGNRKTGLFNPERKFRYHFRYKSDSPVFISADISGDKKISFGTEIASTLSPSLITNHRKFGNLNDATQALKQEGHPKNKTYDAVNKLIKPMELSLDSFSYGLNEFTSNPNGTNSWVELHSENGATYYVKSYIQNGYMYEDGVNDETKLILNFYQLALLLPDDHDEDTVVELIKPSSHLTKQTDRAYLKVISEAENEFEVRPVQGQPDKPDATMKTSQLIPDFYSDAVKNDLDREIKTFFARNNVVDTLINQAPNYVEHRKEIIKEQIRALFKGMIQNKQKLKHKDHIDNTITFIKEIADYVNAYDTDGTEQFDGEFFFELYELIDKLDMDINQKLESISGSLRLLLTHKLQEVKVKTETNQIKPVNLPNDKTSTLVNGNYNSAQRKIIEASEPLIITQAGAGCGKSHTLVGRLKHMKENNIKLENILVLNFTNTAADEIKERFPQINSLTLAKMINTIYQKSFKGHTLSGATTVSNALRTINVSLIAKNSGKTEVEIQQFINNLAYYLRQSDAGYRAKMNAQTIYQKIYELLKNELDLIGYILNAIGMTTLELQPIIVQHHIMQKTNKLNMPKEFQKIEYIFVDEAQDISTFEYILLLELCSYYNSRLFIIGDAGQALYQFRNANPKFLNALEVSGIFETYKLEINYRSRQEILDVANQFSPQIDVYINSKIQLKANNMTKTTPNSIKKHVKVLRGEIENRATNVEYYKSVVKFVQEEPEILDYMLKCIRKGESVAILGWSNKEVKDVSEALLPLIEKRLNRKINVQTLMRKSNPATTSFSVLASELPKTVSVFHNSPKTNAFRKEFLNEAKNILRIKQSKRANRLNFVRFYTAKINEVLNSFVIVQMINNGYTDQQIYGKIKQELFNLENRLNMTSELLKSDDKLDLKNAEIITSTIHGAKGREFDNVLLLTNVKALTRGGADKLQENYRMLNVALTRAINSEMVVSMHPMATYDVKPDKDNLERFTQINPVEASVYKAVKK